MILPQISRGRFAAAAALLLAFGCDSAPVGSRVLVFGAPDAATPEMATTLVRLAGEHDVDLRMTTDPAVVNEDSLARYRGVILLNTSGDALGRRQQVDLERFVEAGGGFLVLGRQETRAWPWLASFADNAGRIAGEGLTFQLIGGGSPGIYRDQEFLTELEEGFALIAGGNPRYRRAETPRMPDSTRFQQKVLAEGTLDEPTEMAIASDGRVFFVERRGALKLYDPAADSTRVLHRFELFTEDENGLIGIALDPSFDDNGWIYLTRTVGDTTDIRHRVARFTWDGSALGDERMLFEVPVDRGCCHTGGSMAFDRDGNLYISFGDNTNPFATSYSPIDDAEGRELWDARRSSANTQDLRGKIVRIRPQSDGTYAIPDGNLFSDPQQGRPEIYTMGHRNPYRISVDAETGYVYWGEVGPDARIDSIHGPMGFDEVNQARSAGNFGWPLFIANNRPYRQRDIAAGTTGDLFDPARPVNDSRFNTGARVLPPAQPAFIWYPYDRSEEFPLLGEGGRTAMAGPVYRSGVFGRSAAKLPDYYDGKLIHYEWIRGWMMATSMDGEGNYQSMEPFLDHLHFDHPMDVELGPDGSLYILEYGSLWFAPNPGARLTRILFHPENRPPRAVISAGSEVGAAPFRTTLSARGSRDADGDGSLRFRWEFADGSTAEGDSVEHTFTAAGEQPVRLIATDGEGMADTATTVLRVGNAPPRVAIEVEGNRSFFWASAPANYHVTVADPEDGALGSGIDPGQLRVTMAYQPGARLEASALGHQAEQTPAGLAYIQQGDCTGCHGIDAQSIGPSYRAVAERNAGGEGAEERLIQKIIEGGSGVWGEAVMPAHPEMSPDVAREIVAYILSLATPGAPLPPQGALTLDRHQPGEAGAYVLTAAYVDQARNGIPPLQGRAQVVLRSPEIPAASIAESWGIGVSADSAAPAEAVRVEQDGAWLHLGSLDLTGVGRLVFTVEGLAGDLTFELRDGSPRGERLAAGVLRAAAGTGRWDAPVTVDAEGEYDLYVVLRSTATGIGPWSPAARLISLRFERAAEGPGGV